MKRSKFITSRYFLISLVTHLSIAALVVYLIYENEQAIYTSSIEIGLIESPSRIKKDITPESIKSKKPAKKQIENKVKSHVSEKSSEAEQAKAKSLNIVKNVHDSKEKAVKNIEKSVGHNNDPEKESSVLILAHPDYKYNPKPNYPIVAKRRGYEGTVLLNVLVLESGRVGDLNLEKASGYPILDKSAIDSVKEWVFVPGKRNGEAVSSWVQVPIKFQLTNI